MPKLKKLAWLVLLPAVLAMLLVACGGDDDDDTTGGDDSNGAVTDNGSDDNSDGAKTDDKKTDDKKDSPLSGGTGSDEKYVADICKLSREWWDDMSAAFTKFDPEKPEEFAKALTDPLNQYANELGKVKPPKDLKEWHEGLVAMFKEMIKGVESGEGDIFSDSDAAYPDMPADAMERLTKIAEKNDDCKALEEEGGSIFE